MVLSEQPLASAKHLTLMNSGWAQPGPQRGHLESDHTGGWASLSLVPTAAILPTPGLSPASS